MLNPNAIVSTIKCSCWNLSLFFFIIQHVNILPISTDVWKNESMVLQALIWKYQSLQNLGIIRSSRKTEENQTRVSVFFTPIFD